MNETPKCQIKLSSYTARLFVTDYYSKILLKKAVVSKPYRLTGRHGSFLYHSALQAHREARIISVSLGPTGSQGGTDPITGRQWSLGQRTTYSARPFTCKYAYVQTESKKNNIESHILCYPRCPILKAADWVHHNWQSFQFSQIAVCLIIIIIIMVVILLLLSE